MLCCVGVYVFNPSVLLICWQPLRLVEDLEMTEQARALKHAKHTHTVMVLVIFLESQCVCAKSALYTCKQRVGYLVVRLSWEHIHVRASKCAPHSSNCFICNWSIAFWRTKLVVMVFWPKRNRFGSLLCKRYLLRERGTNMIIKIGWLNVTVISKRDVIQNY